VCGNTHAKKLIKWGHRSGKLRFIYVLVTDTSKVSRFGVRWIHNQCLVQVRSILSSVGWL